MSNRVEWAEAPWVAKTLGLEDPGEFLDGYGTTNEKPALVLDSGGSLFVIEGSTEELKHLANRINDFVQRYDADVALEADSLLDGEFDVDAQLRGEEAMSDGR